MRQSDARTLSGFFTAIRLQYRFMKMENKEVIAWERTVAIVAVIGALVLAIVLSIAIREAITTVDLSPNPAI